MASSECSAGRAEDCNRLVYEAVNEISVSKFQLVISSYSEIEVLTSLAKSNEKGETPLVIAVKGGNVSLIDELVKFLKTCDRKIGKLNEMSLIAVDQLFHHQIPTQVAHRLCFRSVTDLFLRVCKLFGVKHFYRLSYRSVTDP